MYTMFGNLTGSSSAGFGPAQRSHSDETHCHFSTKTVNIQIINLLKHNNIILTKTIYIIFNLYK